MRWGLWLSTFSYQRGWRHPSFCPGIFFGIPRLSLSCSALRAGSRRPEPRPRSKFGLRSSRFAKPCGPACGSLSRRAQRLGSGSKCAANASRTYIPELYRLLRSLPLISPFGLPAAVARAATTPPGSPACRYTAHSLKTRQSHRTSARFGLLSSRFAKPCGPAYGTR